MHRLLQRQLQKSFGGAVPEGLAPFTALVSEAYAAADRERELLERSMEISSRELLQSNAELRAVLSAFPDLFLWVNAEGRIMETKSGDPNDPYLATTGLVGRNIGTFPNDEVGAKFAACLRGARGAGARANFEYEIARDEQKLVYDARLFGLEGANHFVIIRNVTDTRRVELAEAASRAKGEFIANMSHELRTPLHGILSFARFGKKKAGSGDAEKLLQYFTVIEQSGETLLHLLDEVLDVAKLDAGMMRFDFEQVDLRSVLSREVDQFRSRIQERKLSVEAVELATPLFVHVDPHRIAQVVRNLLSNAVKFSPENGRISIATEFTDQAILITVRDEGPGIPTDELESVFEKFVQSSRTRSGAGGTGLGLTICRQIVEAHGGRIWAEVASPGTRFVVEIPRGTVEGAMAA